VEVVKVEVAVVVGKNAQQRIEIAQQLPARWFRNITRPCLSNP